MSSPRRRAGPTGRFRQSRSGAVVPLDFDFPGFSLVWIGLYPILWAAGLGGAFWVALGAAGGVWLLRQRLTSTAVLALLISAALVASALVGTIAFGLQLGRLISLMGNALVWVALAALLVAASNGKLSVVRLGRRLLWISIAQAAITAAAVVVYPGRLPVPLLASAAQFLPSGFAAFADDTIYFASWLDGFAFRSSGISAQPTWAGAFGACAAIIGVHVLLSESGRYRLLALAGIFSGIYSLEMALSRSGWISLGVAAVAGVIMLSRRLGSRLFGLVVTLSAIASIVVLLTGLPSISGYLEDLNSGRAGSAETRGAIYARTWAYIQELPLPILGYGIKPQEEGLVASVASHSTYLGLLFRGGYVALVLFLLLLLFVLLMAMRRHSPAAAAVVVLVGVWCTLEDFDPGHLLPLALVWAVGVAREPRTQRQTDLPSFESARSRAAG